MEKFVVEKTDLHFNKKLGVYEIPNFDLENLIICFLSQGYPKLLTGGSRGNLDIYLFSCHIPYTHTLIVE